MPANNRDKSQIIQPLVQNWRRPIFKDVKYNHLIQYLPTNEKKRLIEKYAKAISTRMISQFVKDWRTQDFSLWKKHSTTTLCRLCLIAFQKNKLSFAEVISFHLMMEAWLEFVKAPINYYELNANIFDTGPWKFHPFKIPSESRISKLPQFIWACDYRAEAPSVLKRYVDIPYSQLKHKVEKSFGKKEVEPILKKFFALDNSEWKLFQKLMKNESKSEKKFFLILLPPTGSLSPILNIITRLVRIFHPQKIFRWRRNRRYQLMFENALVIPSFSAFQNYLNVIAHFNHRIPIQLAPNFGPLSPQEVLRIKKRGYAPFGLFYGACNNKNINKHVKLFDYYPGNALSFSYHDVFHATRELQMSENIYEARFRLIDLTREFSKKNTTIKAEIDFILDKLIDGVLIFSYGIRRNPFYTDRHNEKFGNLIENIFRSPMIKSGKTNSLIKFIIKNMVTDRVFWNDKMNLGVRDLLKPEQIIYRSIYKKLINHK